MIEKSLRSLEDCILLLVYIRGTGKEALENQAMVIGVSSLSNGFSATNVLSINSTLETCAYDSHPSCSSNSKLKF